MATDLSPHAHLDDILGEIESLITMARVHANGANDWDGARRQLEQIIVAAVKGVHLTSTHDALQRVEKRLAREAAQAALEAEGAESLCRECLSPCFKRDGRWHHDHGMPANHPAAPRLEQR